MKEKRVFDRRTKREKEKESGLRKDREKYKFQEL
jgi:hypothetical protein